MTGLSMESLLESPVKEHSIGSQSQFSQYRSHE
jgi:hypothetical protein